MADDSSTEETPRAAVEVADALQRLVKAQKVLRLYEGTNVVTDRLVVELHETLTRHLESSGAIHLTVREFRLFLDQDLVYENPDRNDSLAFLLFRDGIRRLSIERGVSENELRGFLTALNQVRVVSNTEADLVTLFWELDLKSIHYFAIDELPGDDGGPRVEEVMASSITETGSDTKSSGSIDLRDLDQPVAHLPIEDSQLSESEIGHLRDEIAAERELEFAHDAVQLAVELTLSTENPEEAEPIALGLQEIVEGFVENEDVTRIARTTEHLHAFASARLGEAEVVRGLWGRVARDLRKPVALRRLLQGTRIGDDLESGALVSLLTRLGPKAVSRLVRVLPEVNNPQVRRAVWEAIASHGEDALTAMARGLPGDDEEPDPRTAREMLGVVRRIPSPVAMPILERLLAGDDRETRKEAALTLRKIPGKRAAALWVDLVDDVDPELRSLALRALAQQQSPVLAQRIFERSVASQSFARRDPKDRRKIIRTIAVLGGDTSLTLFADPLRSARKSRWLRSKEEQWFLEALVYGIGCVGGAGARKVLEELTGAEDRLVRSLCQAELERPTS